MLTRRESLALGASALLPLGGVLRAGTPDSLAALARQKGIRFGSTLSSGGAAAGSFRNPDYARLLETQCAILVPENEMKWQSIRPSADAFNFTAFDDMLSYAESKSLAMRGHTLLWHRPRWMPDWAEKHDFGAKPATEAAGLLSAHINTVCARYRGRISSFDVVNETVLEDSTLATTALSRAMGGTEALVDLAFHTARAAAPGVELVYNDYMSWEPGNEKHRAGVLKLLAGFKKRGTPVDALGIQSHIRIDTYDPSTGTGPRQEREWRKFIDDVVAMGYKLVITEFDVNDQALPADIAVRDRGVAAYAKSYLDMMLSYKELKDVLLWGMCDSFSWLQNFEPTRGDGELKRPCPYDGSYAPKPLHAAIAAALKAAPVR
jgi:endo-1,4-beta-xylanase